MTQSGHTRAQRRKPGTATSADGGTVAVLAGLLVLLVSLLAGSAEAGDVVTWVDDEGVTHFGNARLAPHTARRVDVAPANGMDEPEAPARPASSRGPAFILIEREANREPIGWRGHAWNVERRGHR
jgi:hypothetical protein